MVITLTQIKRTYAVLLVLFYCRIIPFIYLFMTGGATKTDGHASASNSTGSLDRQLFGTLFLCGAIVLLPQVRSVRFNQFFKTNFLLIIFVLFLSSSIFWSVLPSVTFKRIFALVGLVLSIWFFVYEYSIEDILNLIIKGIAAAAIMGLIYAILFPSNGFADGGARGKAFLGLFTDKNAGARVYAYGIIILFALKRWSDRKDQLILGAMCLCLLLSNSKSAIILSAGGVSLTFLFTIVSRGSDTSARIRLLRKAIIIIIVSVFIIKESFAFILMMLDRDPTLTDRTVIWELLWPCVNRKPLLGFGYGAFWSSKYAVGFINRWGNIGNAHSGYFETLLNSGWIGLGILLALCYTTLVSGIKLIAFDQNAGLRACWAIIFMILIVNYVGFLIPSHVSSDMFFFLIGCCLIYKHKVLVDTNSNVGRL